MLVSTGRGASSALFMHIWKILGKKFLNIKMFPIFVLSINYSIKINKMTTTTTVISRDELMAELRLKFPDMWLRKSEEFDIGMTEDIWSGENSMLKSSIEIEGEESISFDMPLFNHWATPGDDEGGSLYEDGVCKELYKFLEERGWHCEWYDGGTVLITKH